MAIERAEFPLPDVDAELTAPFFAGAATGELRITRCDACDQWVWYPDDACAKCGGPLHWAAVSGRGTLFSWVVVERAFLPAFADRVPFVTALVALDEDPAVRLCTYVVDADPATLVADEPVHVVFRDLAFTTVPGAAVRVPMFVPDRARL
jgi:uncharacterized OB-fold protein